MRIMRMRTMPLELKIKMSRDFSVRKGFFSKKTEWGSRSQTELNKK